MDIDTENFITIPIFKFGEKYFQFPFSKIREFKPDYIVVTPELRNLTFWAILLLKHIYKYRIVTWTHGINNKDYYSGKVSFSGRLRLMMIKLSDRVITYSKKRAELLSEFTDKKIAVANNTLDSESLNTVYLTLNQKGRNNVFNELGWNESEINFIYVGRLIEDKNITQSLLLLKELSEKTTKKCNFHVVGEGPYESFLKSFVEKHCLHNVIFHGQVLENEKLGAMLYASDLHLHIGYTGLAIVHSLCFESPIVTLIPNKTEGPFHSPEFEYLDSSNSIKGDRESLVEKVLHVISNQNELNQLKANTRLTFEKKCSIDRFLEAFYELEST